MNRTTLLGAMAVTLMAAPILAADLKSGPNVGVRVGKLPVFAATGAHENKEIDYAAERKEKPTIYIFVNGEHFSRPMAQYIREIDQKIANGKEKAEAIVVWMTDKLDETKEYLPKVQQSIQLQATALTIATGDKPRLQDWKINDDAHITVVVVNTGSVAGSVAHQSVNKTDAEAVIKLLKKATGK